MTQVLIIDDNAANMKLAVHLLTFAGYECIEAYNATDGIRLAGERHPDLILMDLNLTDMDGLTATRILRGNATTRDIKIVAFTASAMRGDRERIIAAGCDEYVSKPICIEDFQRIIGEMVAR